MKDVLHHGGNAAAILGLLLCAVSGILRMFGMFYVVGFETITLFNAGTTLLIVACVAKLQYLSLQTREVD